MAGQFLDRLLIFGRFRQAQPVVFHLAAVSLFFKPYLFVRMLPLVQPWLFGTGNHPNWNSHVENFILKLVMFHTVSFHLYQSSGAIL